MRYASLKGLSKIKIPWGKLNSSRVKTPLEWSFTGFYEVWAGGVFFYLSVFNFSYD